MPREAGGKPGVSQRPEEKTGQQRRLSDMEATRVEW